MPDRFYIPSFTKMKPGTVPGLTVSLHVQGVPFFKGEA